MAIMACQKVSNIDLIQHQNFQEKRNPFHGRFKFKEGAVLAARVRSNFENSFEIR